MNAPLNYDIVGCLAFTTIGGEEYFPDAREMDRIQKENIEAAHRLNPAFQYIRNFELARDAWMPRKGKTDLSDKREMAWRRSRTDRIMRLGGGKE